MSDKETMEQKLLRLVATNPGISILPCVDCDTCPDNSFIWWTAGIKSVDLKTRIFYPAELGHVYFDQDDSEEIKDMLETAIMDEFDEDDLLDREVNQIFESLKRETVIALRIGN
jgi:hypothetical protein